MERNTTKTELIYKFKLRCNELDSVPKDSAEYRYRKMEVETKFMRIAWEVLDSKGMIRIVQTQRTFDRQIVGYKIMAFHRVGYAQVNNFSSGYFESELTEEEYNELEKKYFGEFSPDIEYLKEIGAIGG